MTEKLAIVIPAFKNVFFKETLKSISDQTNKNFTLYIGDDCSPENLQSTVNEFINDIDIVYKRFENNLGGADLVSHWERCVALSTNENWIWLFSDDDVMPDDAVERFFHCINSQKNVQLARFNVNIIDAQSVLKINTTQHPEWESSLNFLIRRLNGLAYSFVVEYIFKRELYEKNNGFVNFPAAWASDDATWVLFGKENGIYTIPGQPVLWRHSGLNISSDHLKYAKKKINASIKFIEFIKKEGFKIENKFQVHWLNNQLDLLTPEKNMKRYYYKNILATEYLSAYFKFLIFTSLLNKKIKKLLRATLVT